MGHKNQKILYVTLRPLDSRDIFVPLIREVAKREPEIRQSAISPYLWIFPDRSPDSYLKLGDVEVVHRSDKYSSFDQQFHDYASQCNPDLIIVQIDYPGIYQNIVLWAKERGIKTLVCASESILMYSSLGLDEIIIDQHAVDYFDVELSFPSLFRRVSSEIKFFTKNFPLILSRYIKQYRRLYRFNKSKNNTKRHACMSGADAYVVAGSRDKRILNSLLADETHVFQSGWIRGEKVLSENVLSRKQVCAEIGFCGSQQYVLLVSQCFSRSHVEVKSDYHFELLKTMRFVKSHIPDCRFVLTLHPGEDMDEVRKKTHKYGDEVVLIQAFSDRLALAKYSELLIGYYSTALLEAMFVSRPIITLDYVLLQNRQPYFIEFGAVAPVLHERDIEMQIERVFRDENYISSMLDNQKVLLKDVVGECRGSVGRVVDAMFLLLACSKKSG